MILALWILVGLLAVAGMVVVAWPTGSEPKLAPVPVRRSRDPAVARRGCGRSQDGMS